MKVNIIGNIFKEAGRGFSRHLMISFASITTVTLMLGVLGIFIMFSLNANYIVDKIGTEPPVQIWLRNGVSEQEITAIDNALAGSDDVIKYGLQTPQQNYDAYRETLGEDAALLDSLDPQKLPYSFTVQLAGPEAIDGFQMYIETFPGIDDIQYSKNVLDFLTSTSRTVNLATLAAVAVLLLISLLIISNMVRISILARSEEIAIMKYVGATNSYIRVPYLLEGAFTGIIGAIIAWGVGAYLYTRVYAWAMQDTQLSSAWALLPLTKLIWPVLAILLVTGGLVGAAGSAISVRKHVNV